MIPRKSSEFPTKEKIVLDRRPRVFLRREKPRRNKGDHNKKDRNFLASVHVTPQPESASEPLADASHTSLDQLCEWSDLYRKPSDLLADLESCSMFLENQGKTYKELPSLLDQWKALGRPQIEWRELDSFLRSLAASLSLTLEGNHHHLDQ